MTTPTRAIARVLHHPLRWCFYLATWLVSELRVNGRIAFNAVDGFIRLAFSWPSCFCIAFQRHPARVPGREHKAGVELESGKPDCGKRSRRLIASPRCGTSFLLVVMVISMIIYTLIRSRVSVKLRRALFCCP
jgi:uncharacterized protein YqhQ